MGAVADLWKSERGLLCLTIIVAATVLVAVGALPVKDWKEMTMAIFGIYVVGKTVTGAVEIRQGKGKDAPTSETPTTETEEKS